MALYEETVNIVLPVLQNSTPDNAYEYTIMPLRLDWYCPNAGENQCGYPGIICVHPRVSFTLEPTVTELENMD